MAVNQILAEDLPNETGRPEQNKVVFASCACHGSKLTRNTANPIISLTVLVQKFQTRVEEWDEPAV